VSAVESLILETTVTSVTIHLVPLRARVGRLEVLVCRGEGGWSFPQGAPDPAVPIADEAERFGREQVGLNGNVVQLGAFGRCEDGLELVYVYLVPPVEPGSPNRNGLLPGGSWVDARAAQMALGSRRALDQVMVKLEFDVEYGLSGFGLVREEFTVSELRKVHQCVRGVELDPSNFRKRVTRWVDDGLVQELPRLRPTATRPARLYRLRD
jgi:8-oxo-dGTP diphosphatase